MDKDKKTADVPAVHSPEMAELYRKLQPEMRRPKPNPEALAAALESAQRLAAEADAEQAADDAAQEMAGGFAAVVCGVCGYTNRDGNKFCGMCGVAVGTAESGLALSPSSAEHQLAMRPPATRPIGNETHHYHHHYHHHYFPGGEAMGARPVIEPSREREPIREDKLRATAALRGDMSRAEAAVRKIAHEWVLACNTKHLDDLLELYTADGLVLRSNCPPIRGSAALREFFFGALGAGLGEVELEPLRVEVIGELAYEAGRFKALIPSATGKRREERGKYLWVCARQPNSEWKVSADCWSSDLTLTNMESDVPQGVGVKTSQPPRRNP